MIRGTGMYQPMMDLRYSCDIVTNNHDRNSRAENENSAFRNSSNSTLVTNDSNQAYEKEPNSSRFKEDTGEKAAPLERSRTDMSSASQQSRGSILNRTQKFRFFRDWWLELMGCFLIIGALLAIFVTAYSYQGHTLPEWPHGITINSLLAIYVVILKAAILLILAQGLSHLKWTWFTKSRPLNHLAKYDNASRGPLGSIGLLWALRGRDLVSSIGAIIIIAAVVLDPMAQQLIRYYQDPRPQVGINSTLPRTNAYVETGLHAYAGVSTIPIAVQSAINGGVFVPAASIVQFDCQSGTCSFATPFDTMGFRSICTDVSHELSFTNVTMYQNVTTPETDPADWNNTIYNTVLQNYTMLNATLPSGLSASYQLELISVSTAMVMEYNGTSFEIILGPRQNDPLSAENLCLGPEYSGVDQSLWNCTGYGAARCTIGPAIYSVDANIEAGKLDETLIFQTSDFALSGNIYVSTVDVACLNAEQKSALSKLGYQLPQPTEPQWLPYNVSMYWDSDNNTFIYQSYTANVTEDEIQVVPLRCIYQLSTIALQSLNTFLMDYLSGSILPMGSQWTGSSVAQQFYDDRGISFASVDSMFNNISRALTVHVRENGWVNNSAPALGVVLQAETCIRVRWPLLAFPVILAVLTLIFFVAMVLETRRAQQGVHHDFKSSPLAFLFHGLDEGALRRVEGMGVGESNEVGDLNREAKAMYVRLRPTEKGWRFVNDFVNDFDGGNGNNSSKQRSE